MQNLLDIYSKARRSSKVAIYLRIVEEEQHQICAWNPSNEHTVHDVDDEDECRLLVHRRKHDVPHPIRPERYCWAVLPMVTCSHMLIKTMSSATFWGLYTHEKRPVLPIASLFFNMMCQPSPCHGIRDHNHHQHCRLITPIIHARSPQSFSRQPLLHQDSFKETHGFPGGFRPHTGPGRDHTGPYGPI